jgi:hypothetical protein
MKRLLLPSAFLLALSTFACRDAPLGPTDPQGASRDLSAPNAGGAKGVSADLRSRFKSRLKPRFSLSAAAGNVDPASFSATLTPGQTASEALTVNLPAAPPKGDVLFLFDLTGSMGGALTNLATNAVDIMNAVSNVIPDVNFGLVSHEDYPGTFASSTDAGQACNYGPTAYGTAATGDLPYRLDRSITSDASSVVSAIQAMRTKGGADGPEGYSRALYETYADPDIAWRSGARRVVVSFGDNVPHDCNYDFAHVLSASTLSSGVDPGRDNQVGTSDDLGIKDVLEGMKANGITLVTLHNGGVNALWNSYAAVTGGTSFQVNFDGSFPEGTDPASTIAGLISSAVSTVHALTLEVCSADAETYGRWLVSTSPISYTDVTLPQSRGFSVVVGPPAGVNLQNGDHEFNLCVMGDGVEYGRQHVTISSEGTTTFVEPGGSGEATIEENGKPVAGIKFPEGTFTEGVTVSVEFQALPAACRRHLSRLPARPDGTLPACLRGHDQRRRAPHPAAACRGRRLPADGPGTAGTVQVREQSGPRPGAAEGHRIRLHRLHRIPDWQHHAEELARGAGDARCQLVHPDSLVRSPWRLRWTIAGRRWPELLHVGLAWRVLQRRHGGERLPHRQGCVRDCRHVQRQPEELQSLPRRSRLHADDRRGDSRIRQERLHDSGELLQVVTSAEAMGVRRTDQRRRHGDEHRADDGRVHDRRHGSDRWSAARLPRIQHPDWTSGTRARTGVRRQRHLHWPGGVIDTRPEPSA